MARLFVFAIGGTGSRVLKSLIMLLAAGVKPTNPKHEYEVVPVIIDPHVGNKDLDRTKQLLKNYQAITDAVGTDNGFFATRVTTLKKLLKTETKLSEGFGFDLQQVAETPFRKYIGYSEMDEANRAMADILFSGQSRDKQTAPVPLLNLKMDVGFVGNPNIGSIVLNQFRDSNDFREIANNFDEEDRIFIISSIFGGTGAAGFPIIVKNIRNALAHEGLDGRQFLSNSKIGALTVLPYFNVKTDENSPIKRSHFIAKARSALSYYNENITGNRSVNAMYYIVDQEVGKPYENDPGYKGQQNDAHFVEVASALSIIDFLSIPDSELRTSDQKAESPIYRQFGIKNPTGDIKFDDLADKTNSLAALPVSQMYFFSTYLRDHLQVAIGKHPWSIQPPTIDGHFVTGEFFDTHVKGFLKHFDDWLRELAGNKRSFAPFDLGAGLDAAFRGEKHFLAKGLFNRKRSFSYDNFDNYLNTAAKNATFASQEQKLIRLFATATRNMLVKEFNF